MKYAKYWICTFICVASLAVLNISYQIRASISYHAQLSVDLTVRSMHGLATEVVSVLEERSYLRYAVGTVATMLDDSSGSEAFLLGICAQHYVLRSTLAEVPFAWEYVVVADPIWHRTFPGAARYFDYLSKHGAKILEMAPPTFNPSLNLTATEINMLLKIHFFAMTQYTRIIFLDGDIFPAGDISKGFTEYGNVTFAYFPTRQSPLHGGVYSIAPSVKAVTVMHKLLLRANFTVDDGWENYGLIEPWDFLKRKNCGKHYANGEECKVQPVPWTFAGAKTDQGLFYYVVAIGSVTSVEIEVHPEELPFVPRSWKVYHCIGPHKPWGDRSVVEMMDVMSNHPHYRHGWAVFWSAYMKIAAGPNPLSENFRRFMDPLAMNFYWAWQQTCTFVPNCMQVHRPLPHIPKYRTVKEEEDGHRNTTLISITDGALLPVRASADFKKWARHWMFSGHIQQDVDKWNYKLLDAKEWNISQHLPIRKVTRRHNSFNLKQNYYYCTQRVKSVLQSIPREGYDRIHWGVGVKYVYSKETALPLSMHAEDLSYIEIERLQRLLQVNTNMYQDAQSGSIPQQHRHHRSASKGKGNRENGRHYLHSIKGPQPYNLLNFRNQWLWIIVDVLGKIRSVRSLKGHILALWNNRTVKMRTPFEGERFINSTAVVGILKMVGKVSSPAIYNLATNTFDIWSYQHYRNNILSLHHDAVYNPFANTLLALRVWREKLRLENGSTIYDIKHDEIVEINTHMNIVWRWGGNFEHWANTIRKECAVDWASRGNTGRQEELLWCTDYMHTNSLYWDTDVLGKDSLYIHIRNWDTIYKIDRTTGGVEWGVGRMGTFKLYDENGTEVHPDVGLFHGAHSLVKTGGTVVYSDGHTQHANSTRVSTDERGTPRSTTKKAYQISVFLINDNNIDRRHAPPVFGRTRIVELTVNELERSCRVTFVWTTTDDIHKSQYMGSIIQLPNKNIFIHLAETRQSFEVDKSTKQVVWHLNHYDAMTNCSFCVRSESYKNTRFYVAPIVDNIIFERIRNLLSFEAWPPNPYPYLTKVMITISSAPLASGQGNKVRRTARPPSNSQQHSQKVQTVKAYFNPHWQSTCFSIFLTFRPTSTIFLSVSSITEIASWAKRPKTTKNDTENMEGWDRTHANNEINTVYLTVKL